MSLRARSAVTAGHAGKHRFGGDGFAKDYVNINDL